MVQTQRDCHAVEGRSGQSNRHAIIFHIQLEASMRVTGSLLALALVLGVGISCKLAERLGGDKNAGTVSTLWPDVPPFEGATKADLEIPLGARLMIRAFSQGAINFISFRTNKTAQ